MTVNDVLVEAKYSPAASACYFTQIRTVKYNIISLTFIPKDRCVSRDYTKKGKCNHEMRLTMIR